MVVIAIHYCTINGIEIKELTQKGAAIMAIAIANPLLFTFLVTEDFF